MEFGQACLQLIGLERVGLDIKSYLMVLCYFCFRGKCRIFFGWNMVSCVRLQVATPSNDGAGGYGRDKAHGGWWWCRKTFFTFKEWKTHQNPLISY